MKKREGDIYNRIGIYGIKNTINGHIYIGQTGMNFGDRWDSHRSLLNCGKHDNPHLQSAWNKYGGCNFEFIIVEECEVEELDALEKYYIKKYKDLGLSYNIHDGGQESHNLGKHLSEETKKKIGDKNRINGIGRKASEETKKKMSESHKNKKYSQMSEDGKKNIRNAQQKYYENHPKKLTVDDVIKIREMHSFGMNYSEISRNFNVTPQCINDICKRKRWKQI